MRAITSLPPPAANAHQDTDRTGGHGDRLRNAGQRVKAEAGHAVVVAWTSRRRRDLLTMKSLRECADRAVLTLEWGGS